MPERHYYLICYDITGTNIRYQTRQQLLAFAVGQQKSAYLCWLTPTERQHILNHAKAHLAEQDKFFILHLGKRYQAQYFGTATIFEPDCFIIT